VSQHKEGQEGNLRTAIMLFANETRALKAGIQKSTLGQQPMLFPPKIYNQS
jgi:hypothetical protein